MIIRRTRYYRKVKVFILQTRLKARLRDLHALSLQRAADMELEQTLLSEIRIIKEQLGESIQIPMHLEVLSKSMEQR